MAVIRDTYRSSSPDGPRGKILVLAEIANPEMVSVPLVAWSMVEALAEVADIHVVTHIRNREAIERRGWRHGIDFTTIDTERTVQRIFRVARFLGASDDRGWTIFQALAPLGCWAFERAAWRRFRASIDAGMFSLVHRLTPMSPTTPSFIASALKHSRVPLVVGPLNGGLPWPAGFSDRMLREREWMSKLRAAHRLFPGYATLRRHASAFVAGSAHTLSEIPAYARAQSFYLPENGIDPRRFSRRRTRRAAAPLRGAFIGRLVPYKCADVLLRAAAPLLRDGRLTLDIAGDGPQRHELQALAAALGVTGAVTFHGYVAHEQVQDLLAECDFLALPSIREFGGGVVLEAMALGVAPIVADYGGPRELVDDDSGLRVPFEGPESLVENFGAALRRVADDPALLDRWGAAGRVRVDKLFTWQRKAEQLLALYDWVLTGGAKPELIALPDAPAPPERRSPADRHIGSCPPFSSGALAAIPVDAAGQPCL